MSLYSNNAPHTHTHTHTKTHRHTLKHANTCTSMFVCAWVYTLVNECVCTYTIWYNNYDCWNEMENIQTFSRTHSHLDYLTFSIFMEEESSILWIHPLDTLSDDHLRHETNSHSLCSVDFLYTLIWITEYSIYIVFFVVYKFSYIHLFIFYIVYCLFNNIAVAYFFLEIIVGWILYSNFICTFFNEGKYIFS